MRKERRGKPAALFASLCDNSKSIAYLPSRQPLKFELLRSENGTVIVVLVP